MYTDPEFADPTEMIKYVYNSCTASGRIGDGLDLVRSQKRHLAFYYKFATQEGAVLFNIHAFDLKDELQLLLFDLIKEKMPIWKQMRALEIVAAVVAETLMEMSVTILTTPEEIHWPMGCVTRPGAQKTNKKGKKLRKSKVASLAILCMSTHQKHLLTTHHRVRYVRVQALSLLLLEVTKEKSRQLLAMKTHKVILITSSSMRAYLFKNESVRHT